MAVVARWRRARLATCSRSSSPAAGESLPCLVAGAGRGGRRGSSTWPTVPTWTSSPACRPSPARDLGLPAAVLGHSGSASRTYLPVGAPSAIRPASATRVSRYYDRARAGPWAVTSARPRRTSSAGKLCRRVIEGYEDEGPGRASSRMSAWPSRLVRSARNQLDGAPAWCSPSHGSRCPSSTTTGRLLATSPRGGPGRHPASPPLQRRFPWLRPGPWGR